MQFSKIYELVIQLVIIIMLGHHFRDAVGFASTNAPRLSISLSLRLFNIICLAYLEESTSQMLICWVVVSEKICFVNKFQSLMN